VLFSAEATCNTRESRWGKGRGGGSTKGRRTTRRRGGSIRDEPSSKKQRVSRKKDTCKGAERELRGRRTLTFKEKAKRENINITATLIKKRMD